MRKSIDVERDIHNAQVAQAKAVEDARSAKRKGDRSAEKKADTALSRANSRLNSLRRELTKARSHETRLAKRR